MRKALIVGVDYYERISPLFGCVNDAHSVKSALERHSDGTINFHVKLLTAGGAHEAISRRELRDAIQELYADDATVSLLYFAGHGHIDEAGGYLCASDTADGDDGVSLADVLTFANKSPARSRLVILDSCHSGVAGTSAAHKSFAELSEGLTILTASTADQYATEENGAGVFTTLLVDALNGAAANLVGDVTPGSVYAHIDQSLGPWQQRPIFRTNVKNFVSLKKVQAPISLADLQKITTFFPHAGYEFPLDPSYEPESDAPDPIKTEVFAVLQRYNRVNLVVPVGETHMYHAAMNSRCCKLTVLGEHYRNLVARDLI